MNNQALQAMIDEFGERICIIVFDNESKVYIGYDSSTMKSVNDLKLRSIGGVDMVGIPKESSNPKLRREGVTSTSWHPTECIQCVCTLDEGFELYRLDPMEIG